MATVSEAEQTRQIVSEPRNVLYDIEWSTYLELRENPANYHLRMTYDEGTLEIMSPSMCHGRYARYIDMFIGVWTEELDIPIRGARDLTCKRADLEKGLEPDDCYYVQSEPRMRDKTELDLSIDPPPDLAIEVEVSRTSVPKMPIYAALGIRELWRYDGRVLRVFELVDGQYENREGSICFPNFPVAKAQELLQQLGKTDDTTFRRAFRRWVQETFAKGAGE